MKGFGANDFGFGSSNINGGGGGGYVPYIGATTNVDLGAFNLYATNIGIGTTSVGAPLDIHSTGTIVAQFNNVASTSAFLTFQSNSAGKWRIGNYYNATANDFAIYDVVNSRYRVVLKNNGQLFFNNTNPISSTLTNRSAIWNTWDGLSGDGNAFSNNVTYAGSGGLAPAFTGYKANGTISSPTALLTDNVISQYTGWGYDGTDFYWGASIYHYAASNWTSSSHESGVKIQLVPNGSVANPVTYHTFTTLGFSASGTITANSNGAAPLTGYGLLNIYPSSSYSPISMSTAAGLYGGSMTITDGVTAASGTVSLVPTNQFQSSTYNATNTSVTYTNAATLYISNIPVAGTNVTITNPYSLYVNAGLSKFSGFVTNANAAFGATTFTSGSNAKINITGAITGANTTTLGVHLLSAQNTYTDNSTAASGTATFVTANSFLGLVAAASNTGVTYTNAATVYIGAAPTAGTNATILNSYSLYTNSGAVYHNDILTNTGIAFLNSRVNINGATDRSDFQLNTIGSSLTSNTANIPAAGSISQYSVNTITDVGTALTTGVANAANYGNLIYTSSANRTIAVSNPLTGGIFAITPTISGSSTITVGQGSTIRAISAIQAYFHIPSTAAATSTITHAAGIRSFIQADNSANNYTITNYYGVLISNSTDTVPSTITNRYGIYQEGASDKNVFAGQSAFGATTFTSGSNAKINITGAITGANTTTLGVHLLSAQNTYTDNSTAASGTATFVTANSFLGLVAAASNTGVTYTNAATVYIGSAPSAGTNATITNSWSLYSAAGNVFFGGELKLGTGNTVTASSTNSVTNKIKLVVNGTTYYLLASTSAT